MSGAGVGQYAGGSMGLGIGLLMRPCIEPTIGKTDYCRATVSLGNVVCSLGGR